MSNQKPKLIVILGPTSSGKTKLAVKLARLFNGEIVSADSRQVYIGMDIGTGKDLKEYGRIPYHLIDVASPKQQFSLAEYQKLAYQKIDDIIKRGKTPFLVGGSGLYLQAVIDGYQLSDAKPNFKLRKSLNEKTLNQLQTLIKKYHLKLNESDFNNKRRLIRVIERYEIRDLSRAESRDTRFETCPEPSRGIRDSRYDCLVLGVKYPRAVINRRIDKRLIHRLEKEDMINEVKKLRKIGVSWKRLNDFGLEYRFIAKHLRGEISYNELIGQLSTAIHQFAKRQLTWFKRMSRISWITKEVEAKNLIKNFLRS